MLIYWSFKQQYKLNLIDLNSGVFFYLTTSIKNVVLFDGDKNSLT